MDLEKLQTQSRFLVRQRVRMMVNQYEVRAEAPDGSEGEMVAFAQQKRLAFKEQVTLYTDDSKSQPILGFKARSVIDVGATYDVTDAGGQSIGNFRKDFAKSLLKSTWHLEQPGLGVATGSERNKNVAILRRVWEFIPFANNIPFAWPYHFDFYAGEQLVFSVEKKFGLRDRYVVDIKDPNLDRRLILAQAVALDALQSR
ncbi:LURP-one-related/scramblase family protein [Actinomadura rudentiformis]|uniref:Uncharacterized protein n=1 Tax=Actinomadura rudentiformis TaxID=359158 RepID=A0A6H9YV90_9ACTN|nr:hypothetical protein [Actinomadura rudentiformis]KAB2350999.1 hypothetical protein F8566_08620 [Actinomadura rudentiformis]